MAAIDLTAPAKLPHVVRTAAVPTTCQEYTLPASHGPLVLSVAADAACRVTFDPAADDGEAMPANYAEVAAAGSKDWPIPSTSAGGVVKFSVAAASGTAAVTVTITRPAGL